MQVNSRLEIPDSEFTWTFVRSSGPGGQNVNKVNSKAVLRWRVTESTSLPAEVRARFLARHAKRLTAEGDLLIASQRYRDQGRNIADALEKLRIMVAESATRPKTRRPTKPSRASVERRIASKQARSRKKEMRKGPGGRIARNRAGGCVPCATAGLPSSARRFQRILGIWDLSTGAQRIIYYSRRRLECSHIINRGIVDRRSSHMTRSQ